MQVAQARLELVQQATMELQVVILKYICQAPTVMMPQARFFLYPMVVAAERVPRLMQVIVAAAAEVARAVLALPVTVVLVMAATQPFKVPRKATA